MGATTAAVVFSSGDGSAGIFPIIASCFALLLQVVTVTPTKWQEKPERQQQQQLIFTSCFSVVAAVVIDPSS